MTYTVICYHQKNPTIYNEGTEWEKKEYEFLLRYSNKTVEEAQKEVDELNATKPEFDSTGHKLDWEKIEYLFVSEQERFV